MRLPVAITSAVLFVSVMACSTAGVMAQTSAGSVSGTVTDTSGAPLPGAGIALRGGAVYSTTSDARGTFTMSNVGAGVYTLTVSKAGYTGAVENDVVVLAGQTQSVTVRLQEQTFSSLRTIATVRVGTTSSINTSPAAVNVIPAQAFLNQAQPQVTRVLSQIPGVQVSFPSNSSNAAAPGSITIPNIRNATSYETASLIDGHPISVGQYGDNVTTFLNTFMFGSVEVVKGPGAESPVVNNAIGGTTNLRTKDPTPDFEPNVLFGIDNRGGTYSNFSVADTLGRLGFIVDVATQNNPSALNGKQVYFDPTFGNWNGNTLTGNSSSTQLPGTASFVTNQYPLLACCYTLYGALDQTAELVKLRYKLSPATTVSASYLGGTSYSDQNANTSDFINSTFVPGDPAYSGALKPGAVQVATVFPGAYSGEINNEPIFQAEIGSTLGHDSVLARYYHASISRFQYQGTSPSILDYNQVTLYGTSSGLPTFNGTPAAVGFNDFYQEPELDKLAGWSFQYDHPIGENLITFSADTTYAQSTDYTYNGNGSVSFNLPPGTNQTLSTFLLRGHFYTGQKLESTVALYMNQYNSTYPVDCPMSGGFCTNESAITGAGVTFQSTKYTHFDPRFGFVYRPNSSTGVRFALGSSIAPPFLGLLNQITSAPAFDSATGFAVESQSNGNLRPETAFGYDLGADYRFKDGATVATGDIYLTDLYNRFFGQTVATNLVCNVDVPCPGAPAGTLVVNQTNTNISNARFEGVELSVHRAPPAGWGFVLSGDLSRGFYYALPPHFYCSLPKQGCTPDQNLNIIAGQNTNGVGVGVSGLNYNGNMRIPYSQGYAEINYQFAHGPFLSFGETLYGNNNSLNEPAFGIANATVRVPINNRLDVQISGDNIFNAWPGYLPVLGGGVAIPLAAPPSQGLPTEAATTGNVLGPATWRFILNFHQP